MTLDQLEDETFRPLLHQNFTFTTPPDHRMEVTLIDVRTSPHQGLGRKQFALTFRGPQDQLWQQRTYQVEHSTLGTLDMFVCPVARTAAGTDYEAVFS